MDSDRVCDGRSVSSSLCINTGSVSLEKHNVVEDEVRWRRIQQTSHDGHNRGMVWDMAAYEWEGAKDRTTEREEFGARERTGGVQLVKLLKSNSREGGGNTKEETSTGGLEGGEKGRWTHIGDQRK